MFMLQPQLKPKGPPFKIRSMIVSLHLKGYSNDEICQKLNLQVSKNEIVVYCCIVSK